MSVRCDACKRVLTDAASIARRLGPTCAERRGVTGAADTKAPKTKRDRAARVAGPRRQTARWAQLEMWSENANDGRIQLTGGAPKS